jgi:hypothetical protein
MDNNYFLIMIEGKWLSESNGRLFLTNKKSKAIAYSNTDVASHDLIRMSKTWPNRIMMWLICDKTETCIQTGMIRC